MNPQRPTNPAEAAVAAQIHHTLQLASTMSPERFRVWLVGGLLANVVGNLPDGYWREMVESSGPCEVPGCQCHDVNDKVVAALSLLREDHKRELARRNTVN